MTNPATRSIFRFSSLCATLIAFEQVRKHIIVHSMPAMMNICPGDLECNNVCEHQKRGGGRYIYDHGSHFCACDKDSEEKYTEGQCMRLCELLTVGGGMVRGNGKQCECNKCSHSSE